MLLDVPPGTADVAHGSFELVPEFLTLRVRIKDIGIASVPGSSFYNDEADGARQVRFTFCKTEATLAAASERLAKLSPRQAPAGSK